MHKPNDLVADSVKLLNGDLREWYEERSAIMEFDGGLPREHANCLALLNVLIIKPNCLSGLVAIEIERQGRSVWLLTTTLEDTKRKLVEQGIKVIQIREPVEVIEQLFPAGGYLLPFE